MLRGVAEQLDHWVVGQNLAAASEGLPQLNACTIKVFGQTALMEADVPLTLAATKDVDVHADYAYPIQKEFERLLSLAGRSLDPVAHEAWMPRESRYRELFAGRYVRLLIADPEAVLLSKALKAPAKNRSLLTEYLAKGASERFLKLADKYHLDLEQFV
jgi:hypothetical protein